VYHPASVGWVAVQSFKAMPGRTLRSSILFAMSTAKSLAASQSEFLYPAPALVKAKEVPLGVPIAHPSFISSSIAECARVTSPPKSDASSPIKTVSPAWWPVFFRSFSIVRASSLSCGIGFSLRYPFFQDCDNITNFTGSNRVWRHTRPWPCIAPR
jgi:hypothetical protein